ncbi:MAG: caspase family protein [Treponema sp.]|nr:caspase family protein [Treponema sp.]
MKNSLFFPGRGFFLLLFVAAGGFLFAAEGRYALIIGNGNYRDRSIPSLANPVNDATDVAAALKTMGYNVTLKTNIGIRDMINVVRDFSLDLGRNSDNVGFFWFAGHGLSVRGVHYMLPVDVDPVDESIIARGSYAVDELMEEIEGARNKTNLIVIDACRNNFLPAAAAGSRGVGTRGLAILSRDDYRIRGNKIVYSTMAGKTAADGVPGSRNSPFAQAFLSKIDSPEIFDDVFLDIATETLRLTRGEQEPYSMGTFAVKSYSLNPQGAAAAAPSASVETSVVSPAPPVFSANRTDFTLDGTRLFSLGIAPSFNGFTSANKSEGIEGGLSGSVGLSFTFYEKYGNRGNFFYIPNSFFVSAELFTSNRKLSPGFESENSLNDGELVFNGAIWGLGALYKIRLGNEQRFILNFGPSLVFFTANAELYWYDLHYFGERTRINTYNTGFEPGIGLSGGISFRITRLLSVDLGLAWKTGFIGRNLEVIVTDNSTAGSVKETFAQGIRPNVFGGRLGLTFWWPR